MGRADGAQHRGGGGGPRPPVPRSNARAGAGLLARGRVRDPLPPFSTQRFDYAHAHARPNCAFALLGRVWTLWPALNRALARLVTVMRVTADITPIQSKSTVNAGPP